MTLYIYLSTLTLIINLISKMIRLGKYSLSGHLEAGARGERLLLRHENNKSLGSRKDFAYSPDSLLSPDPVSKMILENHKISFDGKIPVFVSGDGNCLFNSLSVGLVEHEKLVAEIRAKTCLEMVLHLQRLALGLCLKFLLTRAHNLSLFQSK